MSQPDNNRLLPEMRIKLGRDFSRIRRVGGRISRSMLVLNWTDAAEGLPRLAVVTSRKVGCAVDRSRCRRLLRECFRLNRRTLCRPVDLVVVARRAMVGKDWVTVQAEFLSAVRQAKLILAS